MSSKSKSQQQAAIMALAAVKGQTDPSELNGAAEKMYKNKSKKELMELVESMHKVTPKHSNESFIPATLEDFLLENENNLLSTFDDVILGALQNLGLSRSQATFAMDQIGDAPLESMRRELEYDERSIEDIAVEIKNLAFSHVSESRY